MTNLFARGLQMGAFSVAIAVLAVAVTIAARQQPSAQAQSAATPAGTCAISGVVTDAATAAPLAGASVILINVRNEAGQFQEYRHPDALTDAKGRFVFTDLPSAFSYSVAASRVGYNVGEASGGVSIKLADGEWKRDVSIVMPRVSSISGRVTDERGEPIVGTAVRIFTRRLVGGHELVLGGATASTDDRGVYRMSFLEAGSYYVAALSVQSTVPASVVDGARVFPLGFLEGGRSGTAPPASVPTARGASIDADGKHRLVITNYATPPPAGGDGARAYPPTFYPNARTVADAQLVEITFGGSAENVDIQLTPGPASTLSGRVSGATESAPGTLLRLMPRGSEHLGSGTEVATTVIEPDGAFTFLNVPRGDYTLMASAVFADSNAAAFGGGSVPRAAGLGAVQSYGTQYPSVVNTNFTWWQSRADRPAWGRLPVSVGGSVADLDFPLRSTARVNGSVVVDDPSKLGPGEQFSVELEPANADVSMGAFESYTRGDDHAFSMAGLGPARYLLKVGPRFRGWLVKSVTVNGIASDGAFDGTGGQNFDNVVVSVTKAGGLLSGAVHNRQGAAAAAAVILFPTDSRQWVDYGLTPDRLLSVNSDSAGAYRFPAAQPGDYFVVAVPVSQSRAWIDPRFLAAASAQATRVTLSATAPKTQDLTLSEVVVK